MKGNSIIFKLIFELGVPPFVIARTLGTSEVEVYRLLNGKKIPHESEIRLKRLLLDLISPLS